MKKSVLWIVSILLVLSLVLTGCGNGDEKPTDNHSSNTQNNIESANQGEEDKNDGNEEEPVENKNVSATVVNDTAYLPYFEKGEILKIENVAKATMTADREHIIYLETSGDLYISDIALSNPTLITGNVDRFINHGIIGDYFLFSVFDGSVVEVPLYRYNLKDGNLEMLLEDHLGHSTNHIIVESDIAFEFYSISKDSAELIKLGEYAKELLDDRTYCSEHYYNVEYNFGFWIFMGQSGYTALAYENGELYCLCEVPGASEGEKRNGFTIYTDGDCVALMEKGANGGGSRVFVKRQDEAMISYYQEGCYFTPRAAWFDVVEGGCYAIGSDNYVDYTIADGTLCLYWLDNDGGITRINEVSRPASGDDDDFDNMQLLDDGTLIYIDNEHFLHKIKLNKSSASNDELVIDKKVTSIKTIEYKYGKCALITTEDDSRYFMHDAEDSPVYMGMYISLEGISADGDILFLIVGSSNLYALSWSEIELMADEALGLSGIYDSYTAIAKNPVKDSLRSGIKGIPVNPNAVVFQTYMDTASNGFWFYDGKTAEMLCVAYH